jgi:frataxin-like iron-binding protein CyaY
MMQPQGFRSSQSSLAVDTKAAVNSPTFPTTGTLAVIERNKNDMKTRKELKEEYKQMKFKMGVFQIKNNINGKIFIGSSLDLKAIWYAQKLQLDMGMHQNSELQKDWKEFGSENFSYEILDEINQTEDKPIDYKKEIKTLEDMIIDDLQPFEKNGYNKKPKK